MGWYFPLEISWETMNVVPLALMIQMMDQRINSSVQVVVLSVKDFLPLPCETSHFLTRVNAQ